MLNSPSSAPPPLSGLTEILMRGVELAQDRRKTRYSRLRNAAGNGLVDADDLKVRLSPQLAETEAVDPVLDRIAKARR